MFNLGSCICLLTLKILKIDALRYSLSGFILSLIGHFLVIWRAIYLLISRVVISNKQTIDSLQTGKYFHSLA